MYWLETLVKCFVAASMKKEKYSVVEKGVIFCMEGALVKLAKRAVVSTCL